MNRETTAKQSLTSERFSAYLLGWVNALCSATGYVYGEYWWSLGDKKFTIGEGHVGTSDMEGLYHMAKGLETHASDLFHQVLESGHIVDFQTLEGQAKESILRCKEAVSMGMGSLALLPIGNFGQYGTIICLYGPKFEDSANARQLLEEAFKPLLDDRRIPENKTAQEALFSSRERFKGAFDNNATGMALVSPEGAWMMVNDQLCSIIGYSREELMAMTLEDITHPDEEAIDHALVDEIVQGIRDAYQQEKRYVHKDGSVLWVQLNVSAIRRESDEVQFFVAQVQNITESKKQKAELDRQSALQRSILNSATQGIMAFKSVRDAQGEIIDFEWTLANAVGREAVKMKEDELLGKRLLTVMPGNKKEGLFDIYKQVVESGVTADFVHLYDHENVARSYFRTVAVKLHDGFTVSFEDITIEKSAQEKQDALVKQLTNKNSQLREFSQIVSHNIRNPISNLNILLELLANSEHEEEKAEIIEQLGLVSKSLNTLLEDLLETIQVFEDSNLKMESNDLRSVILKTMELLKLDIDETGSRIKMDLNWKSLDYPRIYIESILYNLMSNAIKYRSPDRQPVIDIKSHLEGGRKVLTLRDNGLGIDLTRYGKRMFGLQNRFHNGIEGKGIGLFMTKAQIESLGGTISVTSIPDKWTEFKITF